MAYMKHLGVWRYSTVEEAVAETGRRPYGVRWETRGNSSIAVGDVMSTFAATPPLESEGFGVFHQRASRY
eukprot:4417299-Amphidinium_carterae.1